MFTEKGICVFNPTKEQLLEAAMWLEHAMEDNCLEVTGKSVNDCIVIAHSLIQNRQDKTEAD